jgi:hypothetical protein
MKRTTIFIDEGVERELRLLAQRESVPVAALVREALERYVSEANGERGLRLRFLAAGRSGHHDTAERAEELLWGDLEPHSLETTSGARAPAGEHHAPASRHRSPLRARRRRR